MNRKLFMRMIGCNSKLLLFGLTLSTIIFSQDYLPLSGWLPLAYKFMLRRSNLSIVKDIKYFIGSVEASYQCLLEKSKMTKNTITTPRFRNLLQITGGSYGARLFKLYSISINRLLLRSISILRCDLTLATAGEGNTEISQ